MKVNVSNGFASEKARPASMIEMLPSSVDESFVVCLSSCEKNFLALLAAGHSYQQIADSMDVSINSVRDYVRSVYKKLQVNSRTKAVVKYLGAHLESAPPQPGDATVTMAETTANTVELDQIARTAPVVKSRIFLLDDHAMFREGLRQLIDREPDLTVCGDVAGTEEALRSIEELKPDLTIVDLSLSGSTGMELVKSLKTRHSYLPVLVVSMHEESLYAERALRAGADGYVMKQEPVKTVKAAIRKVLSGDIHLSEKMMASLLGKFMRGRQPEPSSSPMEKLSDRELEVFRMLGQGKTTRLIAKELGLGCVTINTFRYRIMKKLDLKNSLELVLQANRWAHEGNRWQ